MPSVQRWDSNTWEIENGTYFGMIAALTFKGPFEISGVSLEQDCHVTGALTGEDTVHALLSSPCYCPYKCLEKHC